MTLDQLKIGASGTITSVGGDGPLRCRLLDMGLIPRTRVTLQKDVYKRQSRDTGRRRAAFSRHCR